MGVYDFDKFWRSYDAWYDGHPLLYQSELEAVRKVIPDGLGLEIGIGTGRFAGPLEVRVGLDPAMNMLRLAQKRCASVVQATGEWLPFKCGAFHFILIVLTLCFVQRPDLVLRESVRALKKGGALIVAIISKTSSWGEFYTKKKRTNVWSSAARFYSAKDIIKLLAENGLCLTSVYQTLCFPPSSAAEFEEPREGYDQGGFLVFRAVKP